MPSSICISLFLSTDATSLPFTNNLYVAKDVYINNKMITMNEITNFIADEIVDDTGNVVDVYTYPLVDGLNNVIGTNVIGREIIDEMRGQIDALSDNDVSRMAYFPKDNQNKLSNLVRIKEGCPIYRRQDVKITDGTNGKFNNYFGISAKKQVENVYEFD